VAQGFDQNEDVEKASNRFLESLGTTFTSSEGIQIQPRVSLGIVNWDTTENLATAISQADKNMYLAKGRGGHQAVSDGWLPKDFEGRVGGKEYSLTYQIITDKSGAEIFGLLARVELPAFLLLASSAK